MTGQDEMARVEAPGRCTPSEGPPVERPMHPGRDEMEFELNKWSGFALVLAALLVAPVAGAQEQTESEEDTVQTITDAVAAEAVDDGGDAEAADGEPGEEDCDDDAPPPSRRSGASTPSTRTPVSPSATRPPASTSTTRARSGSASSPGCRSGPGPRS
jgi:hypothetical protein